MKLSLDYSDLTREHNQAAQIPPRMRRGVWTRVREAAFDAERYVKRAMPVDTGRARASWGHSTAPASPSDGIWIEDESKLTIIEGSTVEYVEALNDGHSQQAPAGFIDVIERLVAEQLANKLADDVARLT